jgi:hypothetical protein
MKDTFPYPYYFYGSHDSLDVDVLIQIPKEMMPDMQEDRKRLMKQIEIEYGIEWNCCLIVVEDGIVIDTIFPKTWIDSINNSLFVTYQLHSDKQVYPLPITRLVKRNKLLATYKTVRTILSMLSRTHYRELVKPILKGIYSFNLKVDALNNIDFTTIDTFNQDNTTDVNIWKIIAFYIGQNISLNKDDNEIYTKLTLVTDFPELSPFVYREQITKELKELLNTSLKYYIENILSKYKDYECLGSVMICNGEKIDMKKEISL